jgi:AcrR family transcriptional regulator
MGRRAGSSNVQKRRAVLEAAAALVADRGRAAPLAEICRAAGVSRQTIYNHHGSKEGLFEAVAAAGLEPLPGCPPPSGLAPEVQLGAYAARLLQWAWSARQSTALRACGRGLDLWSVRSPAARAPAIRTLAAFLRQETRRGRLAVADAEGDAALFLDLVLAGPQLRILLGTSPPPSPGEIETLARRCTRIFVRGSLEARDGPPPVSFGRSTDIRSPDLAAIASAPS